MAHNELVYLDDARRAVLKADPSISWCLDGLKRVDAVEVVRCKDCRWFDKRGYAGINTHEEDLTLHRGWCVVWRGGTQACGFCSSGERRAEDGK